MGDVSIELKIKLNVVQQCQNSEDKHGNIGLLEYR